MKQLVVGVDGSAPSQMAYHWASALASAAGARITVGHVVGFSGKQHERGRTELADAEHAKRVAALTALGIDCDLRLLEGDPASRLLDLATRVGADMIVVGRRHRSPIAPPLLGSFTRKLLEENEVPIAVIPAPPDLGPVTSRKPKAVVGLDGSASSRSILTVAAALSNALDLDLEAVSVVDIHEEFVTSRGSAARQDVKTARQFLEGLIHDVRPNLSHTIALQAAVGVPSDELLRFSSRAELLVVGHHRATPIGRLLTHATSRYSAAHARCPVVLVPVEPIPASERKAASSG
jgi:nucleotide-binding universal stress UspA family protein